MTARPIGVSRNEAKTGPRMATLLDLAPVLLVVLSLTVKLLYFPVIASLGDESLRTSWWIRRIPLAALGSLGTLLVLFSPLNLLPMRRRLPVLFIGDLLLTLLIAADAIYLRYFGDVLSVTALTAARQVGMISGSIMALVHPTDALFFADLPLLFLYRQPRGASARFRQRGRRATFGLMSIGALLGVIPFTLLVREGESDYFKLRGVAKIGLLNYHAYDLAWQLYLKATASPISPARQEWVRSFLASMQEPGPAHSPLFGIARGRNLIVVMIESLQAFPLGLSMNGTEVTPHLNALARRSMTFDDFYDQTWHGVTSDGEFTALNSLYPLPEGGVPTRLATHHFVGLPRILDENGYSTVSAHGYSGAIWMMSTAHRNYGFQKSYFGESFDQSDRLGMGLSDESFFRQMGPRLQRQREPFMAFLVTLSTHFPYHLPHLLQDSTLDVPGGTLLGAYLQSVHQLDQAIGQFITGLERSGLLDRSVLVIFGDHAASLGGPGELGSLLGRYGGYPRRTPGFDLRYWRAEKRLPLIIHLPHDAARGVRTGSAGHLDIAPTMLSLLGISEPRMVEFGRDLTTGGNSFVVFRDGGFVIGDTACVVPSSIIPVSQCGDLRTWDSLSITKMQPRFHAARDRLTVSDIILTGDLIPWASQLAEATANSNKPTATKGADARAGDKDAHTRVSNRQHER
jgi:lipoteichoic acid synthase